MPVISHVEKRPSEKFPVRITFVDGEPSVDYEVADLNVIALDENNADVTATLIDAGSNQIYANKALVWLQGGTAGKRYTVLATVEMASGEVFQQKIILKVLN